MKEEILNAELATVNMDSAIEITCASLRAMQLFSDQQNKELREDYDQLLNVLEIKEIESKAEIQRLTKELEELREKHEKQIADWKREEKMWGEHELHYKAEIERLTKVWKWIDPPHKPFSEIVTEWKDQKAEIQRLTERNKYLEEHSNERFEQANELNDQDQEIQRLTKELEELKLKLSGKTFFNPFDQENTRLRELLDRCRPYLTHDWGTDPEPEELKKEISNALNHKP